MVKEQMQQYAALYPWKKFSCQAGTLEYRLHKAGKTALVLLTGGIGKSDLFYRHFESFAKLGYTVITFDYSYDFATNKKLAAAISALLQHLKQTDVYLVGQSYGGFLAQVIARHYPERISGLVLSNTGALFQNMPAAGKKQLFEMKARSDKLVRLLCFLPMRLLKSSIRKNMQKQLKDLLPEEKQFMHEMIGIMIKLLTTKHEKHMCKLMSDLITEFDMSADEFKQLKGKVLLLLSEDDNTFAASIKNTLIENMPSPVVRTDISGGHLALLLKIDQYIEAVDTFIQAGK